MKYYFFDTSALFKRYQRERGSDVVDHIFALPDVKLIVLNVTITEALSNFFRLRNIGEISSEELETLIAVFSGEISSRFEIYPLSDIHVLRTEEINRKRRQKPIDTLQIAAALDFIGDDVVLVSSDPDLNKGAELEGIKVCNPEDIEEKGAPIP